MEIIKELFLKPIDRRIEEVIKVTQEDEETVLDEINEYVLTNELAQHFITVYKAIAEGRTDPHEGIGMWISGFFGSGKSSFAKIVGYTVGNRVVLGQKASELINAKAREQLSPDLAEELTNYLGVVNTQIPTKPIIFDVSMDRSSRANEKISLIMYKALLRELGYAEDLDLANLEISLEVDSKLEEFVTRFREKFHKDWEKRRKLSLAINEASYILHEMSPGVYPSPDSWANTVGKEGRADISANELARRAFELASRRQPGKALIFIIDEVGQYVSHSEDKMLDLQGVIQAFGKEGKNRVKRGEAVAPCWILVTAQEKLNEVVAAIDSRRIEHARLQDRFPYKIDLKQSDISEITSKRVLQKTAEADKKLRQLYRTYQDRLQSLCRLERTGRNTRLDEDSFVALYPYLPYQIDLSIDIVSGLRLQRGAQGHIGGSNRTIIKQAQQMLIHHQTALGDQPIGTLVTLDKIYELLSAGGLISSEVSHEIDEVERRLPDDSLALKVAKAIALLEVVRDLPRTQRNLTAVLHPRIDAEPLESQVAAALERLEQAQLVRQTEEGYKLLTPQEKNWETQRRSLGPKPVDRNRILRRFIKEIFDAPEIRGYRYQKRKTFRFTLALNDEVIDENGQLRLNLIQINADEDPAAVDAAARKRSNENREELFWIFSLSEESHRLIEELYRSEKMISDHEMQAARHQLSAEENRCLQDEKRLKERLERKLQNQLTADLSKGVSFFQGIKRDASELGNKLAEMLANLRDIVIPELYPKFEIGNRPLDGNEVEKFLKADNLKDLPAIFYDGPEGLNLVTRQGDKLVPNKQAGVCREILDYLNKQHAYGIQVTGKQLERHFGGLGYAWPPEMIHLALAVLLRAAAIEIVYQGRHHQNYQLAVCRQVLTKHNAFRSASFAPRMTVDVKTLTQAAEAYEQLTGGEVDANEPALAQALRELAHQDRERLLPLLAVMESRSLPGHATLREFSQWLNRVLEQNDSECVLTLAQHGSQYLNYRNQLQALANRLNERAMDLISQARRTLTQQAPIVVERLGEQAKEWEQRLKDLLQNERFYEHLPEMEQLVGELNQAYHELYEQAHRERDEAYAAALAEMEQSEAAEALRDKPELSTRLDRALQPLKTHLCQNLELAPGTDRCRNCNATLSQLEAELSALTSLKDRARRELYTSTQSQTPIKTVKLTSLTGYRLENETQVEQALEKLRTELLELIRQGYRIILE